MGATPNVGRYNEGERMPKRWRSEPPAPRCDIATWGYVVHPSLLPTVFAPSGSPPSSATSHEVVARKV